MMEGLGQMVMVWAALLFFTWPADRYVDTFVKTLPPRSMLRTSDTMVHGFIGAFSWQLICLICPLLEFGLIYQTYCTFLVRPLLHKSNDAKNIISMVNSIMNFFLAFALSCIVDIDHVYKDFIQLIQGGPRAPWERGVFHLVLPPLVMMLVLYITAVIFSFLWCLKFGTLLVACIISHLIRDGIRHGLWLQPIGVTPVLPYWVYVVVTLLLPLAAGILTLRLSTRITASHPIPGNGFYV